MGESKTLVNQRPVKYHGLFDFRELYKVIDSWCRDNGYDKVERKNFEEVFEDGKQIIMELVPYKKISDYAKIEIRVYIEITNCTEEAIERDKLKHKLFKGDIFFSFDCYLITDYEEHWETRPFYYFFRTLVDKFIYRDYTKRYEDQALSDCEDIIREIKSYLNMERYK